MLREAVSMLVASYSVSRSKMLQSNVGIVSIDNRSQSHIINVVNHMHTI